MDRRLAIDTGHPFVIQDVNVDTPLPRELSDDWLTRYRDDPRPSHEIEPDIQAEIARVPLTAVSYLNAMISYSRLVGRVWEGMYSVGRTETAPSPLLCESLEQHITRAQKEIRIEFLQDHSQPLNWPLSSAPWWRTKQRMLMHIVRASPSAPNNFTDKTAMVLHPTSNPQTHAPTSSLPIKPHPRQPRKRSYLHAHSPKHDTGANRVPKRTHSLYLYLHSLLCLGYYDLHGTDY